MPTLLTPNMNLALPVVGKELGPQYAADNNAAFFQVESHNHTSGQGVPIPAAGINLQTDLPFNNNNITLLNAVEFNSNSAPLPGASPFLNSIYVANGDFYFNDGAGNQIKITSGGTVNATSSGISSGTATASFVGGVLVVNQAPNTPGNIQAGSILIGNNTPFSNFVQVQAPNALGANYSLTLPPTNSTGSTAFVTIDISNNMGEGPAVSGGLTTANLSPTAGITAGQLAPGVLQAFFPTGIFVPFGGTVAPSGFLMCDGSAVSRTTYAALFGVIGTAYGNGDGSTTFNVPPPGVFFRNTDPSGVNDPDFASRTSYAGGNSGGSVGSFQTYQIQSHAHGLTVDYPGNTGINGSPQYPQSTGQDFGPGLAASANGTGSTGGNQTNPTNMNANYIIKT